MPDDRINFFLFSFCKVATIAGEGKVPCSEEGSIRVATRSEPSSTVDLFFFFESTKRKQGISKTCEESFFSLRFFVRSFGQFKP